MPRVLVTDDTGAERFARWRGRQIDAGKRALSVMIPGELVDKVDEIKVRDGKASRAEVIEEVLKKAL